MATFSQMLEQHTEYSREMTALKWDKDVLQKLIDHGGMTAETRGLIREALVKVESSIEYLAAEINDLMETEVQE